MEEQEAFRESISGLSVENICKGERELARLQEMKAVVTGKHEEQRKKIRDLWEKTNASDVERARLITATMSTTMTNSRKSCFRSMPPS